MSKRLKPGAIIARERRRAARADGMAKLHDVVEGLTRDNRMMSEELARHRRFRDRVQALLPAQHLAFAPQLHGAGQAPDAWSVYRVPVGQPELLGPDAWPAHFAYRYVDLSTLTLAVERASHDSKFSDLLHVRLQYRNGESRYAVSPNVMAMAKDNREVLRGLSDMIASQLVVHLAQSQT